MRIENFALVSSRGSLKGEIKIHTDSGTLSNINVSETSKNTAYESFTGDISYKIEGLKEGGTARVLFLLPRGAPEKCIKVVGGVETDLTSDCIFGENGLVTLTVTDGGRGDQDGLENGIIIDPIFFGNSRTIQALNPVFATPNRTGNGFTVVVSNYNAAYTWNTPTVSAGSVSANVSGGVMTLTVTGLNPGQSATITQTTSRTGYEQGLATVDGTAAISPALNPVFATPNRTGNGFTVVVSNYNAAYTWNTPTVSAGSVSANVSGGVMTLTVTGLNPGQSATITQTTSRTGYEQGLATVDGTALLTKLTPQARLLISNSVSRDFAPGNRLSLRTTGGSGLGKVSFSVSGTGCSIATNILTSPIASTCVVTATKAAQGGFASVKSAPVTFVFSRARR